MKVARTLALPLPLLVALACGSPPKAGGPLEHGGAPTPTPASLLDQLPEDTALVVGVDVKQVLASAAWARYGAPLLELGEVRNVLRRAESSCGLVATRDVSQVVVAINRDNDENHVVVMIKGAFDEPKLTRCLSTLEQEDRGEQVTAETRGKITEYRAGGDPQPVYVGWAATDTLVIVPAALEGDRGALEQAMPTGRTARQAETLSGVFARVRPGETIWGAADMGGRLGDAMRAEAAGAPTPVAIWLNLTHEAHLSLELGLRYAEGDVASTSATAFDAALRGMEGQPPFDELVKGTRIEARGVDVIVTVNLNGQQLESLFALLDQALPMLIGP